MDILVDLGISDKETMYIGKIVTYWSAIENEIFYQCISQYENSSQIPKELKNLQFSSVLKFWKDNIIEKIEDEGVKRNLSTQHEKIELAKNIRDAIVHSFWEWSSENLSEIKTVRIRKDELIVLTFTVEDLENFFYKVANIFSNVKFPKGLIDKLASEIAENGYSQPSRMMLSKLEKNKISSDWNIIE